jgi:site-specific recombinase XerD
MKKRLPKVVQAENVKKLLSKTNRKCPTGLRNYCMMLLMYRAGLRVSEVVDLQCNQIDWKAEQVRVIGKGDKERLIPLEPWVMDALESWKKIKPKSKYFFCTLEGNQLQRRYVNAMLERASKKAGIERVNPHALRHTCATEMLGDGLNIRDVQQVLGHAHLNTTMIYTHVNPVELRSKIRARKNP